LNNSKAVSEKISGIDRQRITEEMNEKGYALVLQFLPGIIWFHPRHTATSKRGDEQIP